MRCKYCQSINNDNAQFCRECGKEFIRDNKTDRKPNILKYIGISLTIISFAILSRIGIVSYGINTDLDKFSNDLSSEVAGFMGSVVGLSLIPIVVALIIAIPAYIFSKTKKGLRAFFTFSVVLFVMTIIGAIGAGI